MEKEHCPPVSLGEKHRTRHYERCSREHDVQSELSIDVEMYNTMEMMAEQAPECTSPWITLVPRVLWLLVRAHLCKSRSKPLQVTALEMKTLMLQRSTGSDVKPGVGPHRFPAEGATSSACDRGARRRPSTAFPVVLYALLPVGVKATTLRPARMLVVLSFGIARHADMK